MLDRIELEANQTLKEEFKEKWNEKTYQEIRSNPNDCGFTSEYLFRSANFVEFSSSAEFSTLKKLAKLDLQKETTCAELVFSCCKWFPKKEAIESLIELGKANEIEDKVVESVIKFQDHEGYSCLIGLFQTATKYKIRNKKYPTGSMLHGIEESCSYLIHLAKSANLDLDKVLNHTTKNGDTLFSDASAYSEKITRQLLIEDVQVNSVDNFFMTPFFRVRLKIDFRK